MSDVEIVARLHRGTVFVYKLKIFSSQFIEFLAADLEVPGSIPDATRFF
jgi:hypothetical protein